MDEKRELLRHTLATLVYRAAKPMRDIPPRFGKQHAGDGCRSAAEIVAHMCDLLDWALTAAQGYAVWKETPPESFTKDARRFFAAAQALDDSSRERLPARVPGRAALPRTASRRFDARRPTRHPPPPRRLSGPR